MSHRASGGGDAALREYLTGPGDGAPHVVAAFEAHLYPALTAGLEIGAYDSAAFR